MRRAGGWFFAKEDVVLLEWLLESGGGSGGVWRGGGGWLQGEKGVKVTAGTREMAETFPNIQRERAETSKLSKRAKRLSQCIKSCSGTDKEIWSSFLRLQIGPDTDIHGPQWIDCINCGEPLIYIIYVSPAGQFVWYFGLWPKTNQKNNDSHHPQQYFVFWANYSTWAKDVMCPLVCLCDCQQTYARAAQWTWWKDGTWTQRQVIQFQWGSWQMSHELLLSLCLTLQLMKKNLPYLGNWYWWSYFQTSTEV